MDIQSILGILSSLIIIGGLLFYLGMLVKDNADYKQIDKEIKKLRKQLKLDDE